MNGKGLTKISAQRIVTMGKWKNGRDEEMKNEYRCLLNDRGECCEELDGTINNYLINY